MSRRRRAATVTAAALAALLVLGAPPAGADGTDGAATGSNDGTGATGTAVDGGPGSSAGPSSSASGEPNCTKSDGTPGYLSYEGLQFTTMDEQRTEIRPEEQRPGVYLHTYCSGEYVGFDFYPEAQPVDPWALARNVRITPAAPVIQTSPAAADGLVGVTSWFWTSRWGAASASATAGSVSVTVTAAPRTLAVDPGDGSGTITCPAPPPAYAPGADPATGCTHVYEAAGRFTATAEIVYDVSFTSTGAGGVGGSLGTITTSGSTDLTVSEAQAVVTD